VGVALFAHGTNDRFGQAEGFEGHREGASSRHGAGPPPAMSPT
jgi:hypothetical protein